LGDKVRVPGKLRILVVAPFFPNIGGIETVFSLLVREWSKDGHEVRVVHPGRIQHHSSFLETPEIPIYYEPRRATLLALHRWCDIVIHGSLTTRSLPALVLTRKPCIITQHGSVTPTGLSPLTFVQQIKRWLSRRFANITCSQFVAQDLGVKPLATGNPYQEDVFYDSVQVERTQDLLFVGRIVSDKGLILLIRAVERLHREGLSVRLTVIGTGPQEGECKGLTRDLGLEKHITFLGVMAPASVADQMRRHKILVVPSSFWEPFGIVALEGIACGCMVVASKGGGMPESVGPCGVLYENNSLDGLVIALKKGLSMPAVEVTVRQRHLETFRAGKIARVFIDAMRTVILRNQSRRPWRKAWWRDCSPAIDER
jgi:glycogen(starch) synthase